MAPFWWILTVLCTLYIFLAGWAIWVLSRRRIPIGNQKTPVSVIVCARNEEAKLERCLNVLLNQETDGIPYEVLVVDDRSSDNTWALINNLADQHANLRGLHIDLVPEGISPKKHALVMGIRSSHHPIIALTDADCEPSRGWIRAMSACFTEDTGLVAGFSPYRSRKGILNQFVRFEYLANVALSASTISLGIGIHCTSRNLFFRKVAFDEVGGYGKDVIALSGDDTLLLQRMQKKSGWRTLFCTEKGSLVPTEAPETLHEFIRQRIRHFSTGMRFHPLQMALGAGLYLFHLLFVIGLMLLVIFPDRWGFVAPLFAVKVLADLFVAVRAISIFEEWSLLAFFPAFIPLSLLYYILFPIMGTFLKIKWKE